MRPLPPALLLTSLFVLVQTLEDDYVDDNYFLTDGEIKGTNEYPQLAAQLNCTEFIVRHEGVKTPEVLSKPKRLQSKLKEVQKTLYVKDEEGDPENEATEKSARAKRAVVTIERFWTSENISIIDGYSNVAIYPMPSYIYSKSVHKRDTEAEIVSSEKETSDCTAAFDDDGQMFNWYEVIVNHGGPPGKVNATRLTPNATEVLEPCHRPITNTLPPLEDLLYGYELMEYKKVYRSEMAFLRFSGTPSEFVDIIGELIWAPHSSVPRYYRVSYRKDDTGFYINVRRRHQCIFEKNPLGVKCERVENYIPCDTIGPNLKHPKSLSDSLEAALIG